MWSDESLLLDHVNLKRHCRKILKKKQQKVTCCLTCGKYSKSRHLLSPSAFFYVRGVALGKVTPDFILNGSNPTSLKVGVPVHH